MRRTQAAVLTMVALAGTMVACSFQPADVGPQSDPSRHAKVQPREAASQKSEDRAAAGLEKPAAQKSEKRQPAQEKSDSDDSEPAHAPAKKPKQSEPAKKSAPPDPRKTGPAKTKPTKKPQAETKAPNTKPSQPAKPKVKPSKKPQAEQPSKSQTPKAPEPSKSKPARPKPADPTPSAPEPEAHREPQVGDLVQHGSGVIWWPSFKVMPLAKSAQDSPKSTTFSFENSGWTAKELELYTAFNSASAPSHQCGLLPSQFPEVDVDEAAFRAEMQPLAEKYANCLYDAWRPVLEASGAVPYQTITVTACPGPGCEAMQPYYAAVAMEDQIILSEFIGAWSGPSFSRVIAHETAHIIQSSVRISADHSSVVTAGSPGNADRLVIDRRHELQAECLGTTMLDKARPLPFQEHLFEFPVMMGDEQHGDYESIEFWVGQGLKGRVGECNAYLADPSLTTFRW